MAETITVIGAGPVGSLLALSLARRGYQIELFERRPDMRRVDVGGGRSINLAVSTRGLHALHEVGLDDDVLRQAVPMLGRMTHARDGKLALLPYGRSAREYINSMSRGDLNKLLMTRAEESGRVRIHFEHNLASYADGVAVFENGARVAAPVVIGTDGSASRLRRFVARDATEEYLPAGYKELTLPARDGRHAMEKNALHIWPRGQFMLIALPNLDGSFTCTLFLDLQQLEKLDGQRFFEEHFPDALELMPDAAQQLRDAPLGRMVTVKASPWARGTALLLGDAAHAIVPFFGQGMNAGFEDVSILLSMLPGDFAEAFARFSEARKPDADAIADLAAENFIEMRDKVADPAFLAQRALEHELQERMGGRYLTRYQLVTFTRVPYAVARRAGEIQSALLATADLELAERLAEERLVPLLRAHGAIGGA